MIARRMTTDELESLRRRKLHTIAEALTAVRRYRCPGCGGSLIVDQDDEDVTALKCLACSLVVTTVVDPKTAKKAAS